MLTRCRCAQELWKFCQRSSGSPTEIGSFADVFKLSVKHPVFVTHKMLGSFHSYLKTSATLLNFFHDSRWRAQPSLVDVSKHDRNGAGFVKFFIFYLFFIENYPYSSSIYPRSFVCFFPTIKINDHIFFSL